MSEKKFEVNLGNKVVSLTVGKLAPQANGSVLAVMGKTAVLATVVMGKVDKTRDYFPLSVEFADKLYAGGFIKGGKWIKREGNPSDLAILFGRIIDRSIRPLFPVGFRNEVQLVVTVLSNDKDNDVVVTAFTAASAALMVSDIPFNGPVSAIRLSTLGGQMTSFPSKKELEEAELDLLMCRDAKGINMIEAGAKMLDNDLVLAAIKSGMEIGEKINQQLVEIAKNIGKTKVEYENRSPGQAVVDEVGKLIKTDLENFGAKGVDGKHVADEEEIKDKVEKYFEAKIKSEEVEKMQVMEAVDILVRQRVREMVLAGKRYDGRAMDEVRPIEVEVDALPSTHGSALFQRGLTQALTITTLGSLSDQQFLQDSNGETTKRYLHYYSAAPFSTGQTGRFGRPGRREVGHGALAEKALLPVIPSPDVFPYTIALTSEVLSQNGSSSMASTCGSTMSLMAAGVPITEMVGGISVGMVSDELDKFVLLTDIAGLEDHFGDMDFKITGTKKGITAIQLDIKRMGLGFDMIEATFVASTSARLAILAKMESVLDKPRAELSPLAPKIELIRIPEEKIGEVIGSGGKTIKALMQKYGVQIDIEDDGAASIAAADIEKVRQAAFEIESMVREIHIGEEFDGTVTRVEDFGAFVEFLPGRQALLHVSEMAMGFVSKPGSLIKIGDKIHVKVSGFNDNHQIKLAAPEFKAKNKGEERQPMQNRANFAGKWDR